MIAGDSWNAIMYQTMENTSSASAVFFVALIVLGEVMVQTSSYDKNTSTKERQAEILWRIGNPGVIVLNIV